jgi:hypothetical protein
MAALQLSEIPPALLRQTSDSALGNGKRKTIIVGGSMAGMPVA